MRTLSADSAEPKTKSGTFFDSFLIRRAEILDRFAREPYIQNHKIWLRWINIPSITVGK